MRALTRASSAADRCSQAKQMRQYCPQLPCGQAFGKSLLCPLSALRVASLVIEAIIFASCDPDRPYLEAEDAGHHLATHPRKHHIHHHFRTDRERVGNLHHSVIHSQRRSDRKPSSMKPASCQTSITNTQHYVCKPRNREVVDRQCNCRHGFDRHGNHPPNSENATGTITSIAHSAARPGRFRRNGCWIDGTCDEHRQHAQTEWSATTARGGVRTPSHASHIK